MAVVSVILVLSLVYGLDHSLQLHLLRHLGKGGGGGNLDILGGWVRCFNLVGNIWPIA